MDNRQLAPSHGGILRESMEIRPCFSEPEFVPSAKENWNCLCSGKRPDSIGCENRIGGRAKPARTNSLVSAPLHDRSAACCA